MIGAMKKAIKLILDIVTNNYSDRIFIDHNPALQKVVCLFIETVSTVFKHGFCGPFWLFTEAHYWNFLDEVRNASDSETELRKILHRRMEEAKNAVSKCKKAMKSNYKVLNEVYFRTFILRCLW